MLVDVADADVPDGLPCGAVERVVVWESEADAVSDAFGAVDGRVGLAIGLAVDRDEAAVELAAGLGLAVVLAVGDAFAAASRVDGSGLGDTGVVFAAPVAGAD